MIELTISFVVNVKIYETYQIHVPWSTNLVIVIDAIKENLQLMMEVYISQYVGIFVHHSFVDKISCIFCLFLNKYWKFVLSIGLVIENHT